MSRTPDQVRGRLLSTKRGSVDSLKVSLRCGCSENARQMRCTVETDKLEALAIERVLQWVAAAGLVGKAVQSFGGEPLAPSRHRQAADPKLRGDRQIGRAISRQKHDLGTHRVSTRDLPATCPRLKLAQLGLIQLDANRRFPGHPHLPDRH